MSLLPIIEIINLCVLTDSTVFFFDKAGMIKYKYNMFLFWQETETGLYVCLSTFLGLGQDYVETHFRQKGCGLFLHIRREKIDVSICNFNKTVTLF